ALAERAAVEPAASASAAEPAAASAAGWRGRAAVLALELLDGGADLVLLGLRELEAHPPGDGEALAAGLQLRHDLRHRAGLVHGREDESRRDGRDARDRRDLLRLGLREGELGAGEQEGVVECLAGLAELREVG